MTLDELETCIGHLICLARSRGIETIDAGERDYYWIVSSPEWVDMSKEPKLVVGSLDDDEAELEKVLRDPSRASLTDLDRAAAMLRLVAEQLSS